MPRSSRKFGGRFVVRGGKFEMPEGKQPRRAIVVIEFPDYATALACYRSPEYQGHQGAAAACRWPISIMIEGYDGPQPAEVRGQRHPPAIPTADVPGVTHGRDAAGGRRCRRADGPHAGQGDRRHQGLALAGALEDARSPLIGWDAGVLAGLGENGIKLTGDAGPLLEQADGIIDFTAPAATLALAALAAKGRKVHIIGTTGLERGRRGQDQGRRQDAR